VTKVAHQVHYCRTILAVALGLALAPGRLRFGSALMAGAIFAFFPPATASDDLQRFDGAWLIKLDAAQCSNAAFRGDLKFVVTNGTLNEGLAGKLEPSGQLSASGMYAAYTVKFQGDLVSGAGNWNSKHCFGTWQASRLQSDSIGLETPAASDSHKEAGTIDGAAADMPSASVAQDSVDGAVDGAKAAQRLETGPYHALVIGNVSYQGMPKLKTPVADAEAVAKVLSEKYGFKTTVIKNATRRDIVAALSSLRRSLSYEDNLLIYYAGHGVVDPDTDQGYWLPVDAERDNPANWISNSELTNMIRALPSRHVLLIADSCYSGTLTRDVKLQFAGTGDRRIWLERMIEKRSRTVLSSGGVEPVADDGGGKHSVFAKALLDVLSSNDQAMDAQSLFAPVLRKVVLNAEQTPLYADIRLAGHDDGDFVFVPKQ